jgi:AmiR/NasT family two-component response regulator
MGNIVVRDMPGVGCDHSVLAFRQSPEHHPVEFLLAADVVMDRRDIQSNSRCQRAHRKTVVAVLGEECRGNSHNAISGSASVVGR